MKPIQMVDLKTQYQKIKNEIDAAVIGVLESSAFINGKPVQDFAENLAQYLGAKHVIPCALLQPDLKEIIVKNAHLKPLMTWGRRSRLQSHMKACPDFDATDRRRGSIAIKPENAN